MRGRKRSSKNLLSPISLSDGQIALNPSTPRCSERRASQIAIESTNSSFACAVCATPCCERCCCRCFFFVHLFSISCASVSHESFQEQSETEQASARTYRAQRGVESVILHRVARRTISRARKRVVGDATFEARRVAVASARDRVCHTHARLASGLQLHPCVAARSSRCCIPRALMQSLRQYSVDAVHSPAARRQTRVVDAMQRQKTTTRLLL